VDAPDVLAEAAARDGGAAFARVVGDHDGEALVLRARPQGGLAQARMAHDDHAACIDVLVGLEIIESAAAAPGPAADRAPLRRLTLLLAWIGEHEPTQWGAIGCWAWGCSRAL